MPRLESWSRALASAVRFPFLQLAGCPLLVNLEVTRRCNATCDFCRYWHTRREDVLDDYRDVLRALKPAAVMFSGGEPLLRRNLTQIIARVREACPSLYLGLVTNGALLTVERGLSLWEAGLDQLAISLDFLDARHDAARGIPNLAARIMRVAPQLAAAGVRNLSIQTVIKSDNLDCVLEVVGWAVASGLKSSLSAYTAVKADNHAHEVTAGELASLQAVIDELLRIKAETGAIVSSTYYLRRIPEYFANGGVSGCLAGRKFLTVSPAGEIQRCSESPVECSWFEWRPGRFGPATCGACWTSCRGECQAPIDWERIVQTARTCRPRPGRATPVRSAVGFQPLLVRRR